MGELIAYLHSEDLRSRHLTDPQHFSRRRVLDFVTLMCRFFGGSRISVQTGPDRIASSPCCAIGRNWCAPSAPSHVHARKHLPPTVFGNLNQRLFRSLSDKWGALAWPARHN